MNLISANSIINFNVIAADRELGKVKKVYFDTNEWKVEYLKVKKGFWLFGKRTILPFDEVSSVQKVNQIVTTRLKGEELDEITEAIVNGARIENRSSSSDSVLMMGAPSFATPQIAPMPISIKSNEPIQEDDLMEVRELEEKTIRSLREINHFHVAAADGKVGKVENVIFDGQTGEVKYLMVASKEKQIMLPPQWVKEILGRKEVFTLGIEKALVLSSPYAVPYPAES